MKHFIILATLSMLLASHYAAAKGSGHARSAKSGQYVSKSYASHHKSTTVVEHRKK